MPTLQAIREEFKTTCLFGTDTSKACSFAKRHPHAFKKFINEQDALGKTILHSQVRTGPVGIVRLILENGANPNIICKSGYSPLFYSVVDQSSEKLEIINLLLIYGADPNFIKETDKQNLLHTLVRDRPHESDNVAFALIQKGINVDHKDAHGNTPLHYAMKSGNMALILLLLDSNANLLIKNGISETPLDVADDAVIVQLEEKGYIQINSFGVIEICVTERLPSYHLSQAIHNQQLPIGSLFITANTPA